MEPAATTNFHRLIVDSCPFSHLVAGISRVNCTGFHVASDDAAYSHDCSRTYADPRQDERPRPDEGELADSNRSSLQGKSRVRKVVCARTKVSFLGDSRSLHDLDFPQRVGIGAIPQARPVVHRKVPRDLNPSSLMNKGSAMDPCSEKL